MVDGASVFGGQITVTRDASAANLTAVGAYFPGASLFYEVQSLRADSRPVRWIDASSGAVRKAFDALAHGDGTGVKGDVMTVDFRAASGGGFELVSPDAPRATFDAGNKQVRAQGFVVDAAVPC
jgi:bacillolysin